MSPFFKGGYRGIFKGLHIIPPAPLLKRGVSLRRPFLKRGIEVEELKDLGIWGRIPNFQYKMLNVEGEKLHNL